MRMGSFNNHMEVIMCDVLVKILDCVKAWMRDCFCDPDSWDSIDLFEIELRKFSKGEVSESVYHECVGDLISEYEFSKEDVDKYSCEIKQQIVDSSVDLLDAYLKIKQYTV